MLACDSILSVACLSVGAVATAAGAGGVEGSVGTSALRAFPALLSARSAFMPGTISALIVAGGRDEAINVTCGLAWARVRSFRAVSRWGPGAFPVSASSPADSCISICALAWAVIVGGRAGGSGETVWGALEIFPTGTGGCASFEISECPFHVPGCKSTMTVKAPNTAAIAPQRRTGQEFQRRPGATREGSATATSAGRVKAATSRHSAHWLRWPSTCARSLSVRVFSTKAASRLASGWTAP
jgi:hypothetical protein